MLKRLKDYLWLYPKANLTEYEAYFSYFGVRTKGLLPCEDTLHDFRDCLAQKEIVNLVRGLQKIDTMPLEEQYQEAMRGLRLNVSLVGSENVILSKPLMWHTKEKPTEVKRLAKTLTHLLDSYFSNYP